MRCYSIGSRQHAEPPTWEFCQVQLLSGIRCPIRGRPKSPRSSIANVSQDVHSAQWISLAFAVRNKGKREGVDEVNSIQDFVRYRGCTSSTPLLLSPIILIFVVYLTLSFSHKLRYVYPKIWEDKRVNSSEKNIFLIFFPDKCPPISEIL